MKVKVATDLHLYGPSQISFHIDELLQTRILLGDIVDLKNCKKNDIENAQRTIRELKSKFSSNYILGNHELVPVHDVVVLSKTCFVHGDYESWGFAKAYEFRKQKPASGFRFTKKYWDSFRHIVQGKLDTEQLERCYETASSHNCQMLVMGHSHVRNQIRYNHRGIIIVQLPRGFSEIEII